MKRKVFKSLSTLALCATLVVGGTVTAYAASNSMDACAHNYTLKESETVTIKSLGDDKHAYITVTEYYCMDCGSYYTDVVVEEEEHNIVGDSCSVCGEPD